MSHAYPTRGALAQEDDVAGGSSDEDESRLVRLVQRGDLAAYDQLVRRHLPRALAVARRLLKNKEDAEDLVQDAFLRALERINQFQPGRAFAPWFFRLLTNAGLNAVERRARRATEPEPENITSPLETPDMVLEQKEIRERFAVALAALPPRQRLIVALYEVDQVSTSEIAERLGIGAETVRWHLYQARRSLRRALAPLRELRLHKSRGGEKSAPGTAR